MWKDGQDISDGELMLYFLGWFLGLRAGDCTSGIDGRIGFFPMNNPNGYSDLMLMYYLQEAHDLTNPILFAGARKHELATHARWHMMHHWQDSKTDSAD